MYSHGTMKTTKVAEAIKVRLEATLAGVAPRERLHAEHVFFRNLDREGATIDGASSYVAAVFAVPLVKANPRAWILPPAPEELRAAQARLAAFKATQGRPIAGGISYANAKTQVRG